MQLNRNTPSAGGVFPTIRSVLLSQILSEDVFGYNNIMSMFFHLVGVNGRARGYESRPVRLDVQNSMATTYERTEV